jgi:hypothetical protein
VATFNAEIFGPEVHKTDTMRFGFILSFLVMVGLEEDISLTIFRQVWSTSYSLRFMEYSDSLMSQVHPITRMRMGLSSGLRTDLHQGCDWTLTGSRAVSLGLS